MTYKYWISQDKGAISFIVKVAVVPEPRISLQDFKHTMIYILTERRGIMYETNNVGKGKTLDKMDMQASKTLNSEENVNKCLHTLKHKK